jgi:hypothetical protein
MKYFFPYFGKLLVKSSIKDDFHSFLNKAYKRAIKNNNLINNTLVATIEKEYSFTSEDFKSIEDMLIPYIKDYILILGETYNSLPRNQVIEEVESIKIVLDEVWVNIQKAGEYNPIHTHTGDISFVIYQKIDKRIKLEHSNRTANPNGSITFMNTLDKMLRSNPNTASQNIKERLNGSMQYNHMPEDKEIFIFPSNLHHYVEAFTTKNAERISIAGNIFIK